VYGFMLARLRAAGHGVHDIEHMKRQFAAGARGSLFVGRVCKIEQTKAAAVLGKPMLNWSFLPGLRTWSSRLMGPA
jgi:hypothetical protein